MYTKECNGLSHALPPVPTVGVRFTGTKLEPKKTTATKQHRYPVTASSIFLVSRLSQRILRWFLFYNKLLSCDNDVLEEKFTFSHVSARKLRERLELIEQTLRQNFLSFISLWAGLENSKSMAADGGRTWHAIPSPI